jgi:hypothetical protein
MSGPSSRASGTQAVRQSRMTSIAHQKLATLSSKTARCKGNTLVRTCSASSGGERKGHCEEEGSSCDSGEAKEEEEVESVTKALRGN